MKRCASLTLLAVGFSAALANGAAAPQPGWNEASIDINGQQRWYRIYVPRQRAEVAPAVVLLHGGTQSMRRMFGKRSGGTREWPALAEREGVVLITPNGTDANGGNPNGDRQNWHDYRENFRAANVDDVAFIRRLVIEQTRTRRLNAQRIYVTGASNGGMMTYRLLIDAPELFAAGAAFIANLPENADRLPKPPRPTPLLIVNGTEDPLVKWDGGTVGRDRGATISTRQTLEWWLSANAARSEVERRETLPDRDPEDGCRLELQTHAAKPAGAPVWLYTARGAGHAMPSIRHAVPDSRLIRRIVGTACRDAEGAELAWAFFKTTQR